MDSDSNNPQLEKQREYSKKAYWKNHEKSLELARERSKRYREKNREAFNQRQREYNHKNRDVINARKRDRLKNDSEYAEIVRERDRERHARNSEKHRSNRLKQVYKISLDDYLKMYSAQNGKCRICNESRPQKGKNGLVVDHCHAKGHVRGLLCPQCNQGLGKFKDNIDNLLRAIEYLGK